MKKATEVSVLCTSDIIIIIIMSILVSYSHIYLP